MSARDTTRKIHHAQQVNDGRFIDREARVIIATRIAPPARTTD
jgi:hypothetical protein